MQFTRGIPLKAEGAAGRSAPLLLSELSWGLGLGDCSSFPRIVANFFFFKSMHDDGLPSGGGKGKRLGDPPAAPPDPLEVRPLPLPLPSTAWHAAPGAYCCGGAGGGVQVGACTVGGGAPNVIGIIWTYLHEWMGEGVLWLMET